MSVGRVERGGGSGNGVGRDVLIGFVYIHFG